MAVVPITYSTTYETVVTAALREVFEGEPVEQSFQKNTAIALLERDASLPMRGGAYWEVPVGSVGTTRTVAVQKGTTIPMIDSDDVTMARYRRGKYRQPLVVYQTDEEDWDTEERIFDGYVRKASAAKMELNNALATDYWAAAAVTNGLTGIRLAAPTDGGNSATAYGGITGNTNTWWQSQTITSGGVASNVLVGQIDTIDYSLSAGGGETWDWAITTQGLHKTLKQIARTYHNINVTPTSSMGKRVADLGYDVVEYNGRMIGWDRNCPSGSMFFHNNKAVKMATVSKQNYTLSPFVSLLSGQQDGRGAVLRHTCQVVVTQRRLIGSITGLTES